MRVWRKTSLWTMGPNLWEQQWAMLVMHLPRRMRCNICVHRLRSSLNSLWVSYFTLSLYITTLPHHHTAPTEVIAEQSVGELFQCHCTSPCCHITTPHQQRSLLNSLWVSHFTVSLYTTIPHEHIQQLLLPQGAFFHAFLFHCLLTVSDMQQTHCLCDLSPSPHLFWCVWLLLCPRSQFLLFR